MVVVSGSWVKNVATYPAPTSNNEMVIPTNNMSAKAVLICRPNSHPFQERTLCLDQPMKVGRSVARARATSTNAIFDCKVLSRHHALLWYDCGKFYLQDTKSSNGTFVNNNRLPTNEPEPHEVSSGDIVQFGVDVVENNRKVTHGCIIATLKLYLPDGKEAKASPSITEGNRHGFVPLDELYKLNQIIQEACQREQCLETKLSALQHVVDEARRSADESWQVYVGEERLLSRVAALESQLLQAGKNWGEDRLREELTKLNEDRAAYQIAAKESLRKLIAERLEAVAAATEHQRARATAEQEAMLAREELEKEQQEIQQIAQKLSEEQKKSDETKAHLEQKFRDLEDRLEAEQQRAAELHNKNEQLKAFAINPVLLPLEELEEKCNLFIENDLKMKEEMIGENDVEAELNRTNGIGEPQHNHINRTVAPVAEQAEIIRVESDSDASIHESQEDLSTISNDSVLSRGTMLNQDLEDVENAKDINEHDKTNVKSKDSVEPSEAQSASSGSGEREAPQEKESRKIEIDSKTLKYQFQTVQNELRKQIQRLEHKICVNKVRIEYLEDCLQNERHVSSEKAREVEKCRVEVLVLEEKLRVSGKEVQALRDSLQEAVKCSTESSNVVREKESEKKITDATDGVRNDGNKASRIDQLLTESEKNISPSKYSAEELVSLEEELVMLKERYAQINEERTMLNKDLIAVRKQYNTLCNRSHNTMFFYIAPLILMVLYLLISSMFS